MIYFAMMGNYIKIGFTDQDDVNDRISQLNTSAAEKIELICTIEGGRDVESGLHDRFAQFRANGEWFRICPELLKFIIALDGKTIAPSGVVINVETARAAFKIYDCLANNILYFEFFPLIRQFMKLDICDPTYKEIKDKILPHTASLLKLKEDLIRFRDLQSKYQNFSQRLANLYCKYEVSPSKYANKILEEINMKLNDHDFNDRLDDFASRAKAELMKLKSKLPDIAPELPADIIDRAISTLNEDFWSQFTNAPSRLNWLIALYSRHNGQRLGI